MKAVAGRAAALLAKSGLLGLLESADQEPNRLRIVAYHRVDDPAADPDLEPGLVSATPEALRAQAEIIAQHYRPVSLGEVVAAHRGEGQLPARAVLFTVDDGYADFAEHIWPTLRAVGVPVVLFVPTAFPDTPGPGFWWDRLHAAARRTDQASVDVPGCGELRFGDAAERRAAYKTMRNYVKTRPHHEAMTWVDEVVTRLADLPSLHRVLGWDALRQLAGEGVAICSHGHQHAVSTRLSPEDLAWDLRTSKEIVERELGAQAGPPVFAYPSAILDETSQATAAGAGFELAFSGQRRIARVPFEDPYDVSRLPMMHYPTPLFRAQLRPSVAAIGRFLIDGRAPRAA